MRATRIMGALGCAVVAAIGATTSTALAQPREGLWPPGSPPAPGQPPADGAQAPPDSAQPPTDPLPDAPLEQASDDDVPPAEASSAEISLPSPLQPNRLQIHGFASAGAFVSTSNDYIGKSSRGSAELFEAGINFSKQLTDNLRVGLQLYGRAAGQFKDLPPRLDWAYLDYKRNRNIGLRAGIIKMPFGLYNEFADVDSARLPILLPQSVYAIRNRSALLSHIGFGAYGEPAIGKAGALEYQVWLGSLDIPENALTLAGASVESVDTKYITGAQLFLRPVEGLRFGGTFIRTSINFNLQLSDALIANYAMMGQVPADFDGRLQVALRPNQWGIGSVEYARGDWLFAGEYSRTYSRSVTVPKLFPTSESRQERFYVLVTRRIGKYEVGGYYSHLYLDPSDRDGSNVMRFAEPHYAYSRDITGTVRYDVNDYWLWKAEAHLIDGAADLDRTRNPTPKRWWGLFLVKTTVTF